MGTHIKATLWLPVKSLQTTKNKISLLSLWVVFESTCVWLLVCDSANTPNNKICIKCYTTFQVFSCTFTSLTNHSQVSSITVCVTKAFHELGHVQFSECLQRKVYMLQHIQAKLMKNKKKHWPHWLVHCKPFDFLKQPSSVPQTLVFQINKSDCNYFGMWPCHQNS